MQIILKPNSSTCNNNCDYCFYKNKPNRGIIDEKTLLAYYQQSVIAHKFFGFSTVNFSFQGGEPTLLGLDFFKRAIKLQKNINCTNSLQTNGILLNEEWCKFLKSNNFLVGISIDGPKELHEKHRKNFEQTIKGLRLLHKHKIPFNALVCLHEDNINNPIQIYDFLVKNNVVYIQFIPIVNENPFPSVEYGNFMIEIFNKWFSRDFGKIFIHDFEQCLQIIIGKSPTQCIYRNYCGHNPVLEANGDLYSCDHFVTDDYKLGNIHKESILELLNSPKQIAFGKAKANVSSNCKSCKLFYICKGGCPKNRKNKLNCLCEGNKIFIEYILSNFNKIIEKISIHSSLLP